MGLKNLLDYMFSSLFTKHEVAKEYIFTMAFQNDKSNPVFRGNKTICYRPSIIYWKIQ